MNTFATKLRKNDEVIVLTGKNKGQTGKIQSFDVKHNRVFIAGINMVKKHLKPNVDRVHQEGGIVDKIKSVHISNVALVDPKTKKGTRVGFKVDGKKKIRVTKDSGAAI